MSRRRSDLVREHERARHHGHARARSRSMSGRRAACVPSRLFRASRRHRALSSPMVAMMSAAGFGMSRDDPPVGEEEHPVGGRGGVVSWVTMTVVCCRIVDRLPKQRQDLAAGVVSRLPVGSSAKITVGRETSARAIATRCCWPPESSAGRCLRRSLSADPVDHPVDPGRRRALRPAIWSGRRTFSSAVSIGRRLKNWKMKPMLLAAEQGQLACRSARSISMPSIETCPSSAGRGRPGCA